MSSAAILKRVESSTEAGFDISSRFSRIGQVLPSAAYEYTTFAEQILYLAIELEQIGTVLPSLELPCDAKIHQDLVKLLDFADAAFDDVKEALPQRVWDNEVELMLPFNFDALIEQVESLQAAATLVATILLLACNAPGPEMISFSSKKRRFVQVVGVKPSRRVAESLVIQILRVIKSLKLSQPKDMRHRGIAGRRAKAHETITEWISSMLVPYTEDLVQEPVEQEAAEKVEDADKKSIKEAEKVDSVRFDHFGADPTLDGMPTHIRHSPDRVYAKIATNDVDERSLTFYGLPWSKLKDDPKYYIIWKSMEVWECDNLFLHTKKLRINEEQALIKPNEVVDSLLKKWAQAVPEFIPAVPATSKEAEREQFEKDLKELKEQDEKPREVVRHERSFIRERSSSPPPSRHPLPRRVVRELDAKTEYWRPWGQQSAQLFSSLKSRGWLPVYMRGTSSGQTWFYGSSVAHVRRFDESYTPQEGPMKLEDSTQIPEYLIMSAEWIEEEAIQRFGFQFQVLPSGHFSLDPRLTWGDLELLVGATSTFREERLYRKYRSLPGGDLHEPRRLAIPEIDFIHGPSLPNRNKTAKADLEAELRRVPPPPAPSQHNPTRLGDVTEEHMAPSVESQDSFVEIHK
ncbi:hypothetical protein BLS_001965 [Venturia inaequalis]|uniref:Uncharacterized protein n=1 Tax=Venturia inaequalis TaxID=5025 RepID=A0A8H3VEC0_VENIN|nr:hypothetical protein BLS_001965 [Venturia inaequalis]KAE9986181.1 hypothetical protein EG327_004431 [Venturia inaequalis]RDI79251.1 hypothetical protein Vi05172_g10701 [Venturia inaequalis]